MDFVLRFCKYMVVTTNPDYEIEETEWRKVGKDAFLYKIPYSTITSLKIRVFRRSKFAFLLKSLEVEKLEEFEDFQSFLESDDFGVSISHGEDEKYNKDEEKIMEDKSSQDNATSMAKVLENFGYDCFVIEPATKEDLTLKLSEHFKEWAEPSITTRVLFYFCGFGYRSCGQIVMELGGDCGDFRLNEYTYMLRKSFNNRSTVECLCFLDMIEPSKKKNTIERIITNSTQFEDVDCFSLFCAIARGKKSYVGEESEAQGSLFTNTLLSTIHERKGGNMLDIHRILKANLRSVKRRFKNKYGSEQEVEYIENCCGLDRDVVLF